MGFELMVTERGMLIGQREKLGLTQEEVAKRAGVTLEQYQRYERQGVNISSSSMRIASAVLIALELDPTAFINGDYWLKPLPDDDPLNKAYEEYMAGRDGLA